MAREFSYEGLLLLSTMSAGSDEIRRARAVMLVFLVVFLMVVPFAKVPLVPVGAFIPIYESALVITDLITAALLFGQFRFLRSGALWVLACGYLFTGFMTISHALTFPGLFAPTGLLGAGPQSTAWIYSLWHGGFPLFVALYALIKDRARSPFLLRARPWLVVLLGVAAVLTLVVGVTLLTTAGHDTLPPIMQMNQVTPSGNRILASVWGLSVIALALLWRRQPHSVLDLWLMVVMCAWVFDIALSAVLNAGRFDLGFYAGRAFGLLATSFVLLVLLLENGRLYFRLVQAHEREIAKTADLERLNASIADRVEERTAALEALHNKEEELRAIVENLPDCVITIDTGGVVHSANPAVERLLGYAPDAVIGKNVSLLMPEPYRSAHDGYLASYLHSGRARSIGNRREVEGLHRNGERVALELTVTEYRVKGQRFFTGTLRDIRERKHVEAERAQFYQVLQDKNAELERATVVAEEASRIKGSFLATMSHEIRTPLTGMLGMLELLSMTPLESEQVATLDAAWGSARGLLRIVNDILDWSKIEEGKLSLAPQATSLPQLLQEVVNTYSRVASAKSLVLWQNADARLSPAHIVDPLRLAQILNNFVSNAIKFTERGEVALRAELIEQVDSGERIRFSVKDTGIGIAQEVQEHLFQRYRQGGADTARMYGGTGLGLAICRRLAELMDGSIALESQPGEGTTFSITLTLPIAAKPETDVLSTHPELAQRVVTPLFDGSANAPKVLAVDDHPVNRDLLARQLVLLGLHVETAEDGQMALSMWRNGDFSLLITDCHMPEMDGYALTRAIRKIEAAEARPHIPVVAWTANALAEESVKCQAAGMDGLLVKPNNMVQLKRVLRACLPIADEVIGRVTPAPVVGKAGLHAEPINYSVLYQVVPDSTAHVRLLKKFQGHIRVDCAKLLQMLEQRDLASTEATAHRMKGASRMVGAESLAEVCAAIEAAARNCDLTQARAMINELEDTARRLDTYLDELCGPSEQIQR